MFFRTLIPRGKVKIVPAPTVPGREMRLRKFVGAVGPVPHASAVVVLPVVVLPASSASTVTGDVGVTPLAAGVPIPKTDVVGPFSVNPSSSNVNPMPEAPMISSAAVPAVVDVVLTAKL